MSDSDPDQIYPDPSQHQFEQIRTACSSFKDPLPDLITLAQDNKSLQFIAKGLQTLFAQPGIIKYNDESRRELDIAVRTLCFQMSKISREQGQKEVQDAINDKGSNANMVVQLKERLANTENMLIESEKRAEEAEHQNDELQLLIENLKSENNQFFQERTEITNRITKLKSDNDENISQIKNQSDIFEDQIRSLRDKLKLNEFTGKRLENQLEKANEEIANLNADLVIMKTKLTSKSDKLDSAKEKVSSLSLENRRLDAENQKLTVDVNELKQKNKESDLLISSLNKEQLNELELENQKLRGSITHLSEICSTQSDDLAAVQLLQTQSTDLLRQQLELIAQYDAELSAVNGEKEDLQAQSEGDAKLISALQEQVAKARQEATIIQSDEATKELNEVKEILRSRFGETDTCEIIRDLLEGTSNEELKQQNLRQAGLIENVLRFISRIVNTGELKELLAHDSPEHKLADDEQFRDQLLIEIARCRQFATQNNANDLMQPTPEAVQNVINSLANSEKQEQRELFNILASQTLASETLRKLYEKTNLAYTATLTELKKVSEVVNYDGPSDKLPSIIVEKLLTFRAFTQKLANVVDDDYDPNDFDSVLKFLFGYVNDSATVLHTINTDLRQVIEYKGELPELPSTACDYITSLQRQISEAMESGGFGVGDDGNERFGDANGHFHEELTRATKSIKELENSNNTKDAQIQMLQQENDKLKTDFQQSEKTCSEAVQHANDLENKYSKFAENYEDIEQDIEKLRKENLGLRELMEKKSRQFDNRLERLITEEREQHAEDIKRAEERQRKREEKFRDEMSSKQSKIVALKKKMKEIIEQYEKAFKKQKETTAAIRQQNEVLASKLERTTAGPALSSKEMERLKAEVRSLEAEKNMLATKLKQTNEMVNKVQAIRDNYWMAQMAVHDAEAKSTASQNSSSNNNDHFDGFMDQLVNLLEPFMPSSYEANEDAVLNAISTVIERMESAENDDSYNDNSTRHNINMSPNNMLYGTSSDNNNNINNRENELQQTKTLAALQEWDRWGRDLFVNVTDGEVPCQSCKELRYMLGEMILASIGHRKLVYRLESLRSQKQLLLRMSNVPQRKDHKNVYPSFRMLLIISIGSLRVLRKAGHFPTNYVQHAVTPTKQTTVSLF